MSTLFGFTDPFADLLDMQRQMDRLMSAFTADVPSLLTTATTTAAPVATITGVPQPTTSAARARRWSPSLDVWETEQSIVLHAELPGCNLDDIKLSVTGDNRLVLEGHKRTAVKMEKKTKEERWVRRERFEGDFYRTLLLPAGVEASQIRADYANGVLEVVVPKPTRERGAKRQTIDIREGLGATPQLPEEVEQQPKVEKKRAEEEKTEEEEERVEAQPPLQLEKKEEKMEQPPLEKEEKMEQPPLEKKEEVEQPAEESKQLEKEEEKMEQPELKEEERVEARPPQLEKEEEEEAKQTIESKTPAEQPLKEEEMREERVEAQPPQLEEQEEVEQPAEEGKHLEKEETIAIKTPEETTTAEAQPQAEEKMEEEKERVEVQPPQQPQQAEMKEEAKKVEEAEEELVEAQQPPQVPAEKEVPIEPTEEGKREPTTAEPEQMKPQQQEQQEQQEPEEKKAQQEQEEKEGYTPTTQGERSIFIGEGEAH